MVKSFLGRLGNLPSRLFARVGWPIGRKIQLILLFLTVVIVTNSLITLIFLASIKSSSLQQRNSTSRVESAESINQLLSTQISLFTEAVLVTQRRLLNADQASRITNRLTEFAATNFANTPTGQRLKSTITDLQELYPKLSDQFFYINGLLSNAEFDKAQTVFIQDSELINKVKASVNSLKEQVFAEQAYYSGELDNSVDLSVIVTAFLLGFSFIVLNMVGFSLTHALGGAMKRLVSDLNQIAAGKLNTELKTAHRDEIGQIVEVLNRALELIRHVIASSAIGREVAGLAEHLASSSSQQASLAHEQALLVTEISSSLDELTRTIRFILQSSVEVADAANSAFYEAEKVRQRADEVDNSSLAVQQAVSQSRVVTQQMEDRARALAEQLAQLAAQSTQVSEVITFIEQVAAQTHVLSINAAIEAAGAGVYGQRFGVVAGQVKSLARQITGNTEKIRRLLGMTQQNITEAATNSAAMVSSLGEFYQAEADVTDGVDILVQNARNAVDKADLIVGAAKQTVELTKRIEIAVKQHEVASLQVISGLSEIKQAATSNTESSRVLENNSNQLERLSQQLNLALTSVKLV